MKNVKFISICAMLLILIALLIATALCMLWPEDANGPIGLMRWRRASEAKRPQLPQWMEQMIETNANKSLSRATENVLLNSLGHLKISAPEHVMTYITLDSSCKMLKPSLNVFEKHRKDVSDKQLFVRLFKAIRKFRSVYCGRDERYRKLFGPLQDVLIGLHEQFEDCEGRPDWYENANATVRCADARNIMNCYGEALRVEIGSAAERAWKCIFKPVVNEAMIQPCNFLTSQTDDSFDGFSGGAKSTKLAALVLIATFIVIRIVSA